MVFVPLEPWKSLSITRWENFQNRNRPTEEAFCLNFYSWLQQVDWGHYITLGIAFVLVSLLRYISDRPHASRVTVQPLSTATKTVPSNRAASAASTSRLRLRRLLHGLRC